jgi:hypothetical protein
MKWGSQDGKMGGFQSQSLMKWGPQDWKMGGWSSIRTYKQVAKAKLDLNKTQTIHGGSRGK